MSWLSALLGLVFIHSADASYVSKQAMGLVMGLIVMAVVSLIDFQIFTKNAVPLYVINMILLIGVRLFGSGSQQCQALVFSRATGNFSAFRAYEDHYDHCCHCVSDAA